jgi:hypothetical protein
MEKDAGWREETASGKPLLCRLIHPPELTMYDRVLRYLETIFHETRIPPKSQLNFGEVARDAGQGEKYIALKARKISCLQMRYLL